MRRGVIATVLRPLAWLVAGAAITVAAAWGAALWPPAPASGWGEGRVEGPRRAWPRPVPAEWPAEGCVYSTERASAGRVEVQYDAKPDDQDLFALWVNDIPAFDTPTFTQTVVCTGHPLPAMETWSNASSRTPAGGAEHHAALFLRLPTTFAPPPTPLPLRPVWPGFAADTALYAAAAWSLAHLARAGRATLRRRRGRCAACTYDRAGLPASAPCAECGAAGPSGPAAGHGPSPHGASPPPASR